MNKTQSTSAILGPSGEPIQHNDFWSRFKRFLNDVKAMHFILAAAVFFGWYAHHMAAKAARFERQANRSEKRSIANERKLNEVQAKLDSLLTRQAELQEELSSGRTEVNAWIEEYRRAQRTADEKTTALATAHQRITTLEQELASDKVIMATSANRETMLTGSNHDLHEFRSIVELIYHHHIASFTAGTRNDDGIISGVWKRLGFNAKEPQPAGSMIDQIGRALQQSRGASEMDNHRFVHPAVLPKLHSIGSAARPINGTLTSVPVRTLEFRFENKGMPLRR